MEKTELRAIKKMTKSEFGKSMVEEAQNRLYIQKLEKSVLIAQTILASIDECSERIEYFSGWKKTREAQLEALQKGEFSFDKAGEVVYDEAKLNRR
jgi:hypothetical protein